MALSHEYMSIYLHFLGGVFLRTIYVELDEEYNAIKKIVLDNTTYINTKYINEKETIVINHLVKL
jgi:hypothetical protein